MTRTPIAAPIPRITLTPPEAAAALGCGLTYFEEQIAPELRIIRRGRKRLIPIAELDRWAAENAEKALDPSRRR